MGHPSKRLEHVDQALLDVFADQPTSGKYRLPKTGKILTRKSFKADNSSTLPRWNSSSGNGNNWALRGSGFSAEKTTGISLVIPFFFKRRLTALARESSSVLEISPMLILDGSDLQAAPIDETIGSLLS
ncbi:hypothetical protein WICPIJ_002584 [Wickerhamomyces pijperi]|uniref:Uncharacterized protein n=1 Tax=Wickerhamomyces pijperi TaxID=599730 RepID=A0A9P8TPM9_WICPI|nr:hypothetical protein WICPIJ_002584 [Wickerhamomyces pijperi]